MRDTQQSGGYARVPSTEPMFLYLTTTGRRTGLAREIEIWFTERDGRFYIIAEYPDRANWVRNIHANPRVHVRVGDQRFEGVARVVEDDQEPELATTIKALSADKYGWSDGKIVEITPRQEQGPESDHRSNAGRN